MFDLDVTLTALATCVVASPAAAFGLIGMALMLRLPLGELAIARLVRTSVVLGLLSAVAILAIMLSRGEHNVTHSFGSWVVIPSEHFHFTLKVVFDRLSVPMVILSFLLCGIIGVFANAYMHREPGYQRFFFLLAMFLLGMIVTCVSGTIEMLFAGWELVGLASALLVAFFHDRANPVRNGLRTWTVYRVADAAFLVAAVALHHLSGEGDLAMLMGAGDWPDQTASLTPPQALFIGSLLLITAAGKSALVPFSGWLPRAMEGPTPSSAVFYGALSVHLGAFLLLRTAAIIELSPLLGGLTVGLGITTAVLAALSARVQTDIKSALSYSSLTQVGLIVAEIGLGLRYLPLIHIIGHGCLRTLQLVRAPSLLLDYHNLENAIGGQLGGAGARRSWLPEGARLRIYRLALHRWEFDALLADVIVAPFLRVFRWCDGMERRWTDLLSGRPSRESDLIRSTPETIDELL